MKLAHHSWNNCLDWKEGEVGCLIVEHPSLFTNIVEDITLQADGEEGDLVFSEMGKDFNFAKQGVLVRDIIGLDMNHKKIANAITARLRENALTDFLVEIQRTQMAIYTLMEALVQTVNYPLEFEAQFDVSALIKAANVHCAQDGSLAERVLGFSLAAQEFLSTELLVFVGLKAYLSTSDLLALYNDWAYKKLSVLLLESTQREILLNEKTLLIDADLCELLLIDKP